MKDHSIPTSKKSVKSSRELLRSGSNLSRYYALKNNIETEGIAFYTSDDRREMRKFIESHHLLLKVCPYCKHRSTVGLIFHFRDHTRKCHAKHKKVGEEFHT